jgi:hypothetical protein
MKHLNFLYNSVNHYPLINIDLNVKANTEATEIHLNTILINLFSYALQCFTDSHRQTPSPEILETSYDSLEIPSEPGQPIGR